VVSQRGCARAAEIGRMAGVELPIDTWWHEVAFIRRPPAIPSHPTVIDDALSLYFRPEDRRLDAAWRWKTTANSASHPTAMQIMWLQIFVETRAVGAPVPTSSTGHGRRIAQGRPIAVAMHHAGPASYLGSGRPDGFYVACGFSGPEFKLAQSPLTPNVGASSAELILDGQAKTVDISPFTCASVRDRPSLLQGEHGLPNALGAEMKRALITLA